MRGNDGKDNPRPSRTGVPPDGPRRRMYPKALKPLDPIEAQLAEIMSYDPQRKRRALVKMVERHPGHAPAWAELAEIHFRKRRTEECRHAAQRALGLDVGIYAHFSAELRAATSDLMTAARKRAEEEADRRAMLAHQPQPEENVDPDEAASAALAHAMALPDLQRNERLEELTRIHPGHGPTWLALGELLLSKRRIERALGCAERAVSLDPKLEARLSRRMEQARMFHDRDRHAVAGRSLRSSAQHHRPRGEVVRAGFTPKPQLARDNSGAFEPTDSVDDVDPAELDRVLASVSEEDARGLSMVFAALPQTDEQTKLAPSLPLRSQQRAPSHAGWELARVLELPDQSARLAELRGLLESYPDHGAVLYHFAIHAALEGDTASARYAGDQLRVLEPERYRQLYEVAEKYWAAGYEPPSVAQRTVMVQAVEPQKRNTGVIVQAQAAPPPQWHTVRLDPAFIPPPQPVAEPPSLLRKALFMIGGAVLAGVVAGLLISLFA